MTKNSFNVFVITRFGIGQNSKTFYDREIPYLENLLIRSILKQKEFITKWIILIDVKTPKFVTEKLKKLIPKDILFIYAHDVFLSGSTMPNITSILKNLGIRNKDKVVTIRVDADDILSNDYISSVLDVINIQKQRNKYDLISVDATIGIYFYPIRNKLVKVFRKNYSIQALYSIFGSSFKSVHDGGGHGGLEKMVLKKGGIYYQLNNKEFWIRSMRQHSVSQLGIKFNVLFGRYEIIKNIMKILLKKIYNSNTFYKGRVSVKELSNRFEISEKIVSLLNLQEQSLEIKQTVFSPLIKKVMKDNKNRNRTKIQQVLLKMYKKEKSKTARAKIKKEFYNFY